MSHTTPEGPQSPEQAFTSYIVNNALQTLSNADELPPDRRLSEAEWHAGASGYYRYGLEQGFRAITGDGKNRLTNTVYISDWPLEGNPPENAVIRLSQTYASPDGTTASLERRIISRLSPISEMGMASTDIIRPNVKGKELRSMSLETRQFIADGIFDACNYEIENQKAKELEVVRPDQAKAVGQTATKPFKLGAFFRHIFGRR